MSLEYLDLNKTFTVFKGIPYVSNTQSNLNTVVPNYVSIMYIEMKYKHHIDSYAGRCITYTCVFLQFFHFTRYAMLFSRMYQFHLYLEKQFLSFRTKKYLRFLEKYSLIIGILFLSAYASMEWP